MEFCPVDAARRDGAPKPVSVGCSAPLTEGRRGGGASAAKFSGGGSICGRYDARAGLDSVRVNHRRHDAKSAGWRVGNRSEDKETRDDQTGMDEDMGCCVVRSRTDDPGGVLLA